MTFTELSTIQDGRHNAFPTVKLFNGTEFLAFRVSRSHYRSKKSRIAIYTRTATTSNEWIKLQELRIPRVDVRDPELGIISGTLCLAFGTIKGTKSKTYFSKYTDNHFSEPTPLPLTNHQPSKFVTLKGKTFLLTYVEHLLKHDDIHIIELDTTGKVLTNNPLDKQIHGTETDLIGYKGFIYGVTRADKSRSNKSGSFIFKLDSNFNIVEIKNISIRFDCPELFIKDNQLYLLARSTRPFTGKYNLIKIPRLHVLNYLLNTLIYLLTPKTLSLYKITDDLQSAKLTDISIHGDTGYSSYHDNRIFAYSSTTSRKYIPWLIGQIAPAKIVELGVIFDS